MRRKLIRRRQSQDLTNAGEILVADYVTAVTNLSTAETAKYLARRSEEETMAALNYTAPHDNPVYLTPQDIDPAMREEVVRSSVDAHIKKAQAKQIREFTDQQVDAMEEEVKFRYVGRKVKVTVLDADFEPIESYWQDSKNARPRQGKVNKSVKGIIEDISFRKDLLVLKPTRKDRIIIPQRKFLCVYVVNPDTLKPAISLTFI